MVREAQVRRLQQLRAERDPQAVRAALDALADGRRERERTGSLQERRKAQEARGMWALVEDGARRAISASSDVQAAVRHAGVRNGSMTSIRGAAAVLAAMGFDSKNACRASPRVGRRR